MQFHENVIYFVVDVAILILFIISYYYVYLLELQKGEFLATDPDVAGSISGATRFSEK
jgi:hypothetical protein